MKNLAIVDPALGFSEGHHLAAFDVLSHRLKDSLRLMAGSIVTNDRVSKIATKNKIKYLHSFSQPPYSLKADDPWYTRLKYIRKLTAEYLDTIRISEVDAFLHHTVSWEQAIALGAALQNADGNTQHIVFCMFNPGLTFDGKICDRRQYAKFKEGFSRLEKDERVRLYASCHEYALKYQRLLSLESPLAIHPVFFDDVPTSTSNKCEGEKFEIVYFGDAKREKGFDQVPSLIVTKLNEPGANSLLVHYTEVLDPSLRDSAKSIHQLALVHDRLTVKTGYLLQMEVDQILLNARELTLDYDIDHYAEKTSGILWLAMRRNVIVHTPPGTWLRREVENLGCGLEPDANQANYRDVLFRPIGPWILEQISGQNLC